ncbi:MAG: 50S ribosomal protein L15 [Candidatus Babeliaceae bacterium]|jgi:large subunit ribosomal protein L15
MLTLNNLVSSGKKRKRIGRGGSRGGTSGRGHQGQGSRSGGSVGVAYEGGQMPLTRRLPKYGFNNAAFRKEFTIVNLDLLNKLFNDGDQVSIEKLVEKRIIKKSDKQPLKVLGRGALSKKLFIHAHAWSKSAEEAIKNCGGEIHVIKEM